MRTPRTLARVTGVLYLLVAVFTGFAGVVNTSVVVEGDAAATADNIRASAGLYRLGFVSELVGAVAFLLTGMALYLLLRHVDRFVAAALVVFVAVGVALQTLNLLNQKTALTLAVGGADAGSDRLTALFAEMQRDGYLIAQTYFGLWLLPLGYLVLKSDYFPRPLGVLLMAGCCGHLVDVFGRFLAPGFGAAVSPFALAAAAVAELSFIGWLLIKAVPGSPVPD
ncbi:DUF4386 domain-containing protein [Actinosynnema sp. NPDC047251]|uniref:Uncharacterized protein n=1 Tax=Saccharothrix espanaensis (strain ATCC 51144 / DSM 44229 / JCM 9112 / NBRC 15066 / NRRL 15764) TaxID=1179773 RepID=K0K122_SACES|nr:DUF4386 domain-containing protein [Saccharothrix espanaensis]CCH32036.1 hypothetical protein BN6_47610 [Saccharothrix espanaensis DSM 44229]